MARFIHPWLLMLVAASCGGGLVAEPQPGAGAGPRPEPTEQPAEPEPAPAAARCHLSCCSAEMQRLQREEAARTGDPSIANECCFCDDDGD